jgi:endonuclease-8
LELARRVERTEGLVGQRVDEVEARGKNLLVHFEGGLSLHVHLKMWGRIFIKPRAEGSPSPSPDRVVLLETDEHRVEVVRAPVARLIRRSDLVRDLHFRDLGPDLLGPTFDMEEALRRFSLRLRTPLGEALMDQSAVAGIGNVWKSELCFNLKLDPFAPVAACEESELRALLTMARTMMQETVARQPRRIPDPFTPKGRTRATRLNHRHGQKRQSVYGRSGEACYDCRTRIEVRHQGEQDRSTYYCPTCQPARTPEARAE